MINLGHYYGVGLPNSARGLIEYDIGYKIENLEMDCFLAVLHTLPVICLTFLVLGTVRIKMNIFGTYKTSSHHVFLCQYFHSFSLKLYLSYLESDSTSILYHREIYLT